MEGDERMKEIWKDIIGYEGRYVVSNTGIVKSVAREIKCGNGIRLSKEKIVSQDLYHRGYYRVQLWKDNKGKNKRVHRLVAESFIANPHNLPEVNHIDHNKINNNLENLEWCSGEDNRRKYKEYTITL